jgi:hypothetical protein
MFTESCGLVQHIRAKGSALWNPTSYGISVGNISGNVRYCRLVAALDRVNACFQADLATHHCSYPLGGDLSISANGILYILGTTGGALAAVNLQ